MTSSNISPDGHSLITPSGVHLHYEKSGDGPPLVLVHGAFSDHRTNWAAVKPLLEPHFTIHALARRGRGQTDATTGHALEDESADVMALIRRIGTPVHLLGHSYGALVALGAAAEMAEHIRKLILYEPPWPHLLDKASWSSLEVSAEAGDWEGFASKFFAEILGVPPNDLDELRSSADWTPIVADAAPTCGDLRAHRRFAFEPERYRALTVPVLLQTGSESPPDHYVTAALAAVLPHVTIGEMAGQGHEAMTTAPALYAEAVRRFLSGNDALHPSAQTLNPEGG